MFTDSEGPPGGVGKWVDGGEGGHARVEGCHMHTRTQTHTHTRIHMHVKHDKHGCLHVGSHLQFLYMRLRACACVHMCACVW